ncbi:TadE/TadG family type IV pilus assembly protein [Bifidobacterium moraviense]|uniref:TadE/TadG family type IV pilus assembly protein n=1 Tax=Bifidobacterium moraviense TaxID=2675323 RepID=UPI002FFAB4C7
MTAEFAVILPVVMTLVLLLLGLTQAIGVSLACQDAARAAAYEVVVAGADADPVAAARAAAGTVDVAVSVDHGDDGTRIRTTCPVMPGPLDVLPVTVGGTAMALGDGS